MKTAAPPNYPDTGCRASPTCLACPFERCKHDDPTEYRAWVLKDSGWASLREAALALSAEGATAKRIAEELGVDARTVFRWLAKARVA